MNNLRENFNKLEVMLQEEFQNFSSNTNSLLKKTKLLKESWNLMKHR